MLKSSLIYVVTAAAFLVSAPVSAAVISASEADANGQDFGNNPNQAEVFGADVLTVTGGQKNHRDSDYLTFSGFAEGTQSLDLNFTNPGGTWGGFNLRIKETAFQNKNDWWPLVFSTTESGVTDSSSRLISYALNGYTGPLYVAIDFFNADFRNGNGLSYTITTTAGGLPSPSPAPAPVPLPAGLPLVLAGLGSLVVLRRATRK